jgi:hypothetical protein
MRRSPILNFFYKTCYLYEEVNCTKRSPSASVPGLTNAIQNFKLLQNFIFNFLFFFFILCIKVADEEMPQNVSC